MNDPELDAIIARARKYAKRDGQPRHIGLAQGRWQFVRAVDVWYGIGITVRSDGTIV